MATLVDTAIVTSNDIPDSDLAAQYNGKMKEPALNGSTTAKIRETKYRHVFATHSSQRTSCLSSDTEKTPSFVGFRNLMVIVLGECPYAQLSADNCN